MIPGLGLVGGSFGLHGFWGLNSDPGAVRQEECYGPSYLLGPTVNLMVHKALFTCAFHFSVATKYAYDLPGVDCLSVLPTPSCPNLAKSVLELPKQAL